jgi:hypothetical protein
LKIAAVFGNVGKLDPHTYVERMCKAQIACEWHTYEVFKVRGGAIGIVRTSECYGSIPMFIKGKNGNILAISGVPTKNGNLRQFLNRIIEMSAMDAGKALTELDGAYAVVYWNRRENEALLVTDFMGFQPIYIHRSASGVAIASEIKAFSIGGVVPVQPDPAGWGAFIAFGHSVGDRTQLSGVSRLRGVRLTYVPEVNAFNSESYWEWPERRPTMALEDISLKTILNCFRDEVEAYSEYKVSENTILMSSGFDSRLILCLLAEKGISMKSLSVQHKGHYFGAEGKLGQKVAKLFGVSDAVLVNPLAGEDGEISKTRYLAMNDVTTPGKSLHISNVAGHVTSLKGAVWEGFAPGYTVTQLTDNNMESFLAKKNLAKDSDRWRIASKIFTRDFCDLMNNEIAIAVQKEREMFGEDDYGVMRFVFKNRALNRTGPNPLKVYANTVIPFMPGLSKKYWNYISSIPPLIIDTRGMALYRLLFKEHYPLACSVPFCSEKGLFSVKNRTSMFIDVINSLYRMKYYYDRRHKIPFWGKFVSKKYRQEKERDAFCNTNKSALDKGYLNPKTLKKASINEFVSPNRKKELDLYYYWSVWEMVMNGTLTPENCHKLRGNL